MLAKNSKSFLFSDLNRLFYDNWKCNQIDDSYRKNSFLNKDISKQGDFKLFIEQTKP